jgi:hypothetical protein
MLSTRNLITNIREVPETWIFEYYAGLNCQLNGEKVNIKSLFNPKDKRPSMFIFWSSKYEKYWFHDFSSGKSGDAISLVKELFGYSFGRACVLIKRDYARFLETNTYQIAPNVVSKKYSVKEYIIRDWNVIDAKYWTQFNISSFLLERYFVRPLYSYVMENRNDPADNFTISDQYLYGYFTPEGVLYKIYRPKNVACKFIKVQNYIQGIDQIEDRKCLILVSSLKDGLSLKSLELDLDFIAPDSENSILSNTMVQELLERFRGNMFTLLDNDEAGIKAMKKYRTLFNIQPILIPLSKDLSDSIKDYSPQVVLSQLVPKIDKKLNLIMAA